MSRSGSPATRSEAARSRASVFVLVALVIVWGAAPAAAQTAVPFAGSLPLYYPQLAGTYNRAVAAGDLNGDGRADLIVGQPAGVKVAFGDGNGGMSAAVSAGTGATPNSIAVADLDGDGDLDIVTSNHGSGSGNTFSLLFNNAGAFTETIYTVPAGHRSLKVTTGNVSGDARPEVIVLSDKLVMVWNNDGSGGLTLGFSRPYATPNCCTHSGYSAVRVAMVTNDQHADLVLSVNTYDSGGEPQLQIMPGLGGGNFQPTAYYRYPNASNGRPANHTTEVEVADVNGDGALDVIAGAQRNSTFGNSHLVVMRNDGTGAFPAASGSSHSLDYIYSQSVMVGDLNDDGHVDIVGTITGGNVAYFLNDGAGNFPAGVSNWSLGGFYAATLADLNGSGNGSLDLVLVRDNAVFTLLNGTVSDSTPPVVTPVISGTSVNGWYTSDVTVTWNVNDPDSAVTSAACTPTTVTEDTDGTPVSCTATSLGGTTTQSVTIKRDTTGPAIASVTASPGTLWSPNHKMHAVTVSVDATDAGAGMGVCKVESVASNEGGNAHEPDVELTGNLTLNLRAERDGNAAGRIYTIHVSCKDAVGNTTASTTTVTVAHDQGKKK